MVKTLPLRSGDEGMLQRLNRRTSLVSIEIETPIQEISEARQFLELHIIHILCVRNQPCSQISSRLREVEDADDVLCR